MRVSVRTLRLGLPRVRVAAALIAGLVCLPTRAAAQPQDTPLAAPPPPVLAMPAPTSAQASPAPAVSAAPVPLTLERVQTLRRYKAQRLSVHEETELRGGGASMAMGMGMPYGRYGTSTALLMTDPVYTVRTWGVYRGPDRITNPVFLEAVGKADAASALRKDINRYDRRSKRLFGVAGLGAGVMVASLVGMRSASSPEEYLAWNLATLGGTAAGLSGLVIGSFPAAKAGRLERTPAAVMRPDEARALAEAHNDALQKELGVTPQEAWLLELGDGR